MGFAGAYLGSYLGAYLGAVAAEEAPDAPVLLSVYRDNDLVQDLATWEEVPGAASYNLYASETGSPAWSEDDWAADGWTQTPGVTSPAARNTSFDVSFWYYVVTAVGAGGAESAASNMVQSSILVITEAYVGGASLNAYRGVSVIGAGESKSAIDAGGSLCTLGLYRGKATYG